MILTAAIVIAIAALYAGIVILCMSRRGLSLRQALLYAPLKVVYRIDDADIAEARTVSAPVVYVVTHQSRLDPALMLALLPEDTLHILDARSATAGWMEPFRELGRTIAFNAEHVFVSRRLARVLKGKGRMAVYLPDTVEPEQRPFRLFRAVARIAMKAEASIVPVFIEGSASLPYSLAAPDRAPSRLLPRLTVRALKPLSIPEIIARSDGPAQSATNALFDRVAEARVEAKAQGRSLFEAVVAAASRVGPDRVIVEDVLSGTMTYRRLLIATRIVAGRIANMTAPGDVVGIMLPNANGLATALLATLSAGRTAAMINYTSGSANVASAVQTTMMRRVISSRAFVEKADLKDLVTAIEKAGATIVWLEDLRAGVSNLDKAAAALLWRRPVGRQDAAKPALVMFTSGSENAPKAVVLSNANVVHNAMQAEARLAIDPRDRLMNVLPAFHSFGLTGGLMLPLLAGVHVLLYPSPLHYKIIPKIAARFGPTILVGTDTFLTAYAATAKEGDFSTLRFAVAGAEAVRAETRRIWKERFHVRLLEGFGMTEASPVVAVNTATHGRDGTVGRLLPGLRYRLEPVEGVGEGGRLWISGPNVMLGTMTSDKPGLLQPLANGWHDSGDIVSMDREGFVTIKGRAKRFAKIAGEMVSLGAVEMLANAAWPEARNAAVSVPDARRGERIVLVTTETEADVATLRQQGRAAGATELMIPHDIIKVEEVPLLAMGKTDYAATRAVALQQLGLSAAA